MNRPPLWFTIVAIVALLWNLLGCVAVAMDFRISAEDMAKMSAAQQAMYNMRPAWAVAANALGVIGGTLGCIGLLVRRRWALPAFVASLIGIVIVDFGVFVVADGASAFGLSAVILQGSVAIVAVGLIVLSRRAIARGWLR